MAINLRDYSRTAAQRGWGSGWPSCSGAKGNLAIVTFARSKVRVSVHKRIARLVQVLGDETERRGYLAKLGQTGAYNCRPIGGTSSPSNHSWGLAIDWNWQDNPFTSNKAANHIPAWMPPLWNRYGFAWGGHYSGKFDFMHFECMGTPAQMDEMTALAVAEILGGTAPLPPSPSQEDDMAAVPQDQWDKVYWKETTPLEYSTHHGATKDDQFGHTLSIRKEVVALRSEVAALRAMLSSLPIALRNAMEGKAP